MLPDFAVGRREFRLVTLPPDVLVVSNDVDQLVEGAAALLRPVSGRFTTTILRDWADALDPQPLDGHKLGFFGTLIAPSWDGESRFWRKSVNFKGV